MSPGEGHRLATHTGLAHLLGPEMTSGRGLEMVQGGRHRTTDTGIDRLTGLDMFLGGHRRATGTVLGRLLGPEMTSGRGLEMFLGGHRRATDTGLDRLSGPEMFPRGHHRATGTGIDRLSQWRIRIDPVRTSDDREVLGHHHGIGLRWGLHLESLRRHPAHRNMMLRRHLCPRQLP